MERGKNPCQQLWFEARMWVHEHSPALQGPSMELWGEGLRRGDKPALPFARDPQATAWPCPREPSAQTALGEEQTCPPIFAA